MLSFLLFMVDSAHCVLLAGENWKESGRVVKRRQKWALLEHKVVGGFMRSLRRLLFERLSEFLRNGVREFFVNLLKELSLKRGKL